MNLIELMQQFPDQKSCVEYLEKKRWGDKIRCVYCNSENTHKQPNDLRHHCNGCRKSFNVTVGTIFHDTKLPLQKWFIVMSLMMNAKKGLSACQVSRDIGLRRPTVWLMMHKIRKAMNTEQMELLSGIVEMDETYVGGKPRKEAKKKSDNDDDVTPPNKRGRGTKKECVVGMVERDGKVKAQHVNKDEIKGIDLTELVRKNVDIENAVLMTDEYKAYNSMKRFIKHLQVNHSKEYARDDKVFGRVHTNTIEGFWALLKRGIVGQFHKVSKKYLHQYIDEFCFRYNERKNDDIFNALLMRCI